MDLQTIIDDLIKQIETLKARVVSLEQENALLQQANVLLRQEDGQLRRENDTLKERLGLNSKNSSLPPSRDLYRAKKIPVPQAVKNLEANRVINFRAISRNLPMRSLMCFLKSAHAVILWR